MSSPPATHPDLVRVEGPRRGALPAAGVAVVLVAVVGVALVGGSRVDVSPTGSSVAATNRASSAGQMVVATIAAAVQQVRASRPPRLGPPPWARGGRTPVPGSSPLQVLGWRTDPYET